MSARAMLRSLMIFGLPLALGAAGCDCDAAVGGPSGATCRSGSMFAAALSAAGVMSLRYLEVRVELTSTRTTTREVVTPRVRAFGVTRTCPPRFG